MYHTIVTHQNPHVDEIGAIWLLRKFGEEFFPGVTTASIEFWTNGGEIPDGRTAEELEQEGVLLVGVGRGRFDEHPGLGRERKKEECAATLVAKALNLDDDPALEKILAYIKNDDLKGGSGAFDLGKLAQMMYKTHDTTTVINWAIIALEAKYQEQLSFWTITREEFSSKAKIEEIPGPNRPLQLVVIESDNNEMAKFYKIEAAGNNAVLIQKRSNGQVLIHTNQRHGLKMSETAKLLRVSEARIKGQEITNWSGLGDEGKYLGAEEWYYQAGNVQAIMNGSFTAPDVPPTKLSLEEIVKIVKAGVNPQAFEPSRENLCTRGICNSRRENPCPFHSAGLNRCLAVRAADRRRNAS